jgi:hypothetical protein
LRAGFSSVRVERSERLGRSGGGLEDSLAAGAGASLREVRRLAAGRRSGGAARRTGVSQ